MSASSNTDVPAPALPATDEVRDNEAEDSESEDPSAPPASHWSRYELHNRTSIHSKKLIITISPPRSNNTANSLAKSINLIMKALITRRPGYELSYESHNEANSGLIARDQSETSR